MREQSEGSVRSWWWHNAATNIPQYKASRSFQTCKHTWDTDFHENIIKQHFVTQTVSVSTYESMERTVHAQRSILHHFVFLRFIFDLNNQTASMIPPPGSNRPICTFDTHALESVCQLSRSLLLHRISFHIIYHVALLMTPPVSTARGPLECVCVCVFVDSCLQACSDNMLVTSGPATWETPTPTNKHTRPSEGCLTLVRALCRRLVTRARCELQTDDGCELMHEQCWQPGCDCGENSLCTKDDNNF